MSATGPAGLGPESRDKRAEAALLGSLLIDPEAIGRVRDLVRVEDFAYEHAARIYAAMLALHERREPTCYVRTEAELAERGDLEKIGGPRTLLALVLHCPTSVYAAHYAGRVAACARRRAQDAPAPERTEPASLSAALGWEG